MNNSQLYHNVYAIHCTLRTFCHTCMTSPSCYRNVPAKKRALWNMEEKLALVSIKDFQENAKRKLDKNAYLYYSSGALSEQTLHDNVNAYKG